MTSETNTTPEFADFVGRHIGPRGAEIDKMLEVVGASGLDALVDASLPGAIRITDTLGIQASDSENAVLEELQEIASRNTVMESMIGLGYYGTIMPSVIRRRILESPAWYTAYTPYQAEIAQGRLEALLNFQTVVSDLTGLPVANASLLDESTSAAEAMTLMRRASKAPKDAVMVVDSDVFPQTLSVIRYRAEPIGLEIVSADLSGVTDLDSLKEAAGGRDVFGVLVQYPSASGQVHDWSKLADAVHEGKGLITAAADILSLALLKSPGEWGADVAVGSTQRLGVPMQFGGPHAGYMAVQDKLVRSMPGRIIGISVDEVGAPALRMAMQTREQHIRREKATSNVCTAQALLAILASMYAVYHGPGGLKAIAMQIHARATVIADKLEAAGYEVATTRFFDTITVKTPGRASSVQLKALARGINIWRDSDDAVQLTCDETTTNNTVSKLLSAFGVKISEDDVAEAVAEAYAEGDEATSKLTEQWGEDFARTSPYLTADVFNSVHSESQMLRYQRKLSDMDYALDRGMIPLGSCTMKYNPKVNEEADGFVRVFGQWRMVDGLPGGPLEWYDTAARVTMEIPLVKVIVVPDGLIVACDASAPSGGRLDVVLRLCIENVLHGVNHWHEYLFASAKEQQSGGGRHRAPVAPSEEEGRGPTT